MCFNPQLIANNSVYKNAVFSDECFEVPCGSCLECRDSQQADWERRLSFEIYSLYKRLGHAVFLTLTFDDDSLPYMRFPQRDASLSRPVPCFDNELVKAFLLELKKSMLCRYGKGSYKYFIAEEFGKTTQRPHLHLLAFLESNVDMKDFYFLVDSAWLHGFIFPKYDPRVDDFVKYDKVKCCMVHADIELMDRAASAKYISKYITKDLSFYSIPEISNFMSFYYPYIKEHGLYTFDKRSRKKVFRCLSPEQVKQQKLANNAELSKWRRYLPKHFQSNFIGYSILDNISSVVDAFDNGVLDPLSKRIVPLPRYAKNKILFKSVLSDRVSDLNGKLLYDRFLSPIGEKYLYAIFKNRIGKMSIKFREFLSRRGSIAGYCQRLNKSYQDFCSSFDSLKSKFSNIYDSLASVYCGSRFINHNLRSHQEAVGSDMNIYDPVQLARLYVLNKHTRLHKFFDNIQPVVDTFSNSFNPLFSDVKSFLRDLVSLMQLDRKDSLEFNYARYDRICQYNRKYTFGYPENFC